MEPLISLRGIRREYAAGDQRIAVLKDVDLDIGAGEMLAIVGQSGSGKSTLMNILGFLDRPNAGTYRFSGREIGALAPDDLAELRREHFGFIFQRYQLLGDLDAVGNVEVPAVYKGMARADRRDRARALLTRLGLGERLDHRPGELSGGQQQRVSVARALMNGGEVILADEPTGALDSASGAELMRLLQELHAEGHTIVIVTHDPGIAAMCERVVEMKDGRIISDSRGGVAGVPRTAPQGRRALAPGLDRLREAFVMALKAMAAHRMRSFLTMLGIIIGIASVVSVVALGSGSQQQVLASISNIGSNTIDIRNGSGFGNRDASRVRSLTAEDAAALAVQPYAAGVSPTVSSSATIRYGATEVSASVTGVGEEYFTARAFTTTAGSTFDADAVARHAQEAVIDTDGAESIFDKADPVGQVVMMGRVPVRIVGVVEASGTSFGPRSSLNLFIPYTTAMSRLSGQDYVNSISVRVSDDFEMDTAEALITQLLTTRHGKEDFFLTNTDTIREAITSTTQTLTLLIAGIAVISLFVGGVGVMNIMLVSVTERTKEIGVRIAVGARRADIVTQFLIEAVLVCLLGGILGIALALGLGRVVTLAMPDTSLIYSTTSIVVAVLSSSVIGVTFGFLPARAASRLDPVEALTRE
ncbi:MacB family efflux pump subunit [Falsirhodobacter algicola]|uniref:Pyoverdine export ATP-binding/permease protein PvdT n=1 Tax=Falsirhodobacter algicola TaxID=2692330 RepID=A0A8J8SL37_9RHOB|nr:MacB family efflux pump subunit [Falsirhodobacter algicola]QUS36026.1 MacB family efflux pump subunit [Falsirhodobacter algicola]